MIYFIEKLMNLFCEVSPETLNVSGLIFLGIAKYDFSNLITNKTVRVFLRTKKPRRVTASGLYCFFS